MNRFGQSSPVIGIPNMAPPKKRAQPNKFKAGFTLKQSLAIKYNELAEQINKGENLKRTKLTKLPTEVNAIGKYRTKELKEKVTEANERLNSKFPLAS